MPETRTEREKLVEAMKRRALARIDPVLRPDHDCREREPDLPGSWCSWCMVLAAADLLSEEGEPDIDAVADFFCLAMVNSYEVDAAKERVPEGTKMAGTLWLTSEGQFVLEGRPSDTEGLTDEQADARHNCDRMGCSSVSHVTARYQAPIYVRPGPVQEASDGR